MNNYSINNGKKIVSELLTLKEFKQWQLEGWYRQGVRKSRREMKGFWYEEDYK